MSVADPEASARFYEQAFGLKRVGETESELASGVYLSDGTVSLALLKYKSDRWAGERYGKDFLGVHHVGFWVDDLEQAEKQVAEAGARFFADLPEAKESLYYEKKYQDPDGIIFDLTPNGWAGTKK
jgi:methylmalonyl-CoA/ethylmalonyl-CoA epimerase